MENKMERELKQCPFCGGNCGKCCLDWLREEEDAE